MRMLSRTFRVGGVLGAVLLLAACDKAQLLAPTKSTITVSAPTRLLPTNGSTEVTAFVMEEAGTPVQNGTTVRFVTSLGRVDPVEAQTRNGLAITTFFAGTTSGVAEVRATSGGATGGTTGTGTGATSTAANVIQITIGTAAVNLVTIRANPGSVSPNGGSVELIATVVAENGRPLEGILVTFNADQGSLASSTALTNSNGEARATLTTGQATIVSATAGAKTSTPVTVSARPGPTVTIGCVPAGSTSTTSNCASVQASTSSNTATVLFTVTKPTGSSTLRTATLDFGDGTSVSLGNLAGGSATATHTYAGPSGSSARPFTATVQVTDINNESAAASTTVIITPRSLILNVTLTATPGTSVVNVGNTTSFTAAVTPAIGGFDMVESYTWNFGDGSDPVVTSGNATTNVYTTNGRKEATVTVRTSDGRTATARAEFIISGI